VMPSHLDSATVIQATRTAHKPDFESGSREQALLTSAIGSTCSEKRWAVFPVIDKVPMAGSHGFRDAASDPSAIRELWRKYSRANGVGIATGASSGIWVLDVDIKDGHRGDETLHELETAYGSLPSTVQVVSGSGGLHYYFGHDEAVRGSVGSLGDGLDVRSDGGYIVAAGSRHDKSASLYHYEVEHHPDTTKVVAAPSWLVNLAATTRTEGGTILGEGELAEMVSRMLREGWGELAPSYGRRRLCRPGVDHESASLYPPDGRWPEGRLCIWTTSLPGDYWLQPGTYGRVEDQGSVLLAELATDSLLWDPRRLRRAARLACATCSMKAASRRRCARAAGWRPPSPRLGSLSLLGRSHQSSNGPLTGRSSNLPTPLRSRQ
jgi:Bifunctional DNA primase/polymerase, N-terminal